MFIRHHVRRYPPLLASGDCNAARSEARRAVLCVLVHATAAEAALLPPSVAAAVILAAPVVSVNTQRSLRMDQVPPA